MTFAQQQRRGAGRRKSRLQLGELHVNNALIPVAFVLAGEARGNQKMKELLQRSTPGFTERSIPNALAVVDYRRHFQCLTELI